ncbi:MAG: hypothetical protein AABZ47_03265 [Planctomycetota bacterium]
MGKAITKNGAAKAVGHAVIGRSRRRHLSQPQASEKDFKYEREYVEDARSQKLPFFIADTYLGSIPRPPEEGLQDHWTCKEAAIALAALKQGFHVLMDCERKYAVRAAGQCLQLLDNRCLVFQPEDQDVLVFRRMNEDEFENSTVCAYCEKETPCGCRCAACI